MDIAQRVIRIHNLICSRVAFFVTIVVSNQELSINGFSNSIRYREEALRGPLLLGIHFGKMFVEKGLNVPENEGDRRENERDLNEEGKEY